MSAITKDCLVKIKTDSYGNVLRVTEIEETEGKQYVHARFLYPDRDINMRLPFAAVAYMGANTADYHKNYAVTNKSK